MIIAVIDTVVFIRGTLSPGGASASIVQAFRQRRFALLSSRQHMEEIFRVLGYPRIQRRFSVADKVRKKAVSQISFRSRLIFPTGALSICRDTHDDYLIEIALLGEANYLVTGDADLYDDPGVVQFLGERGTQVVRAAEFARILRGSET